MNEKRMLLLSFFVVAFLMFLLAGWYYFSQQKQAAEVVVDRNYDYVMKNDPIGQNKQAQTDYYTLVLSWSPAFCERQRQQYGDNLPTSLQYQCGLTQQLCMDYGHKTNKPEESPITRAFVRAIYRNYRKI